MVEFQTDWWKSRLKDIRKSQAALARHIDADPATISNMLHGRRALLLEEVEPIANFLEVSVSEILIRAGLNVHGGVTNKQEVYEVGTDGGNLDVCEESATWVLPEIFTKDELSAQPDGLRIIKSNSNDMAPTINVGDRVIIDTGNTKPSPAGVFAVNDGYGVVLKRVAPTIQSGPPALRVSSDGVENDTATVPVEDLKILGRVLSVINRI